MGKRSGLLAFVLLFVASAVMGAQSYRPNEVLCKLKPTVELIEALSTYGSDFDFVKGRYPVKQIVPVATKQSTSISASQVTEGVYKIQFSGDVNVPQVVADISRSDRIEWVQPNYTYKIAATPNDPRYSTDQNTLAIMTVPQAWDVTFGSSSVVIGVIDTGVFWTHEDLVNQIWRNPGEIPGNGIDDDLNGYIDDVRGWDFVSTSVSSSNRSAGEDYSIPDNDPMDFCGHGTFVSGIIAAQTNNAVGMAGIANVRIMPLRAGYKTQDDCYFDTDALVNALAYAANNRANIVNMSFGGEGPNAFLASAVAAASSAGVVLVAAAGNESRDVDTPSSSPCVPATYPNVIAVSSTDANGIFSSSFSNYGANVDLSAPGESIFSTRFSSTLVTNTYGYGSGTSFSSPAVAAIAGLVLSMSPTANVDTILFATATDKGVTGKDPLYGYGIVSAFAAVALADVTPPTIVSFSPVTSSNLVQEIPVTLNVTDNVTANVRLVYRYFVGATASSDWTGVTMSVSAGIFSATIPTPSSTATTVRYYLVLSDLNPANTYSSPSSAPTAYYTLDLRDHTGPEITSVYQANDYVAQTQTLSFQIRDFTAVSENSFVITVTNAGVGLTVPTSSYSFQAGTLTLDLSRLIVNEGSLTVTISVQDVLGNLSTYNVGVSVTSTQNSALVLTGPDAKSPVFNAPNPFDPTRESTYFCYENSLEAAISIGIYTLNMDRVSRIDRTDLPGYHEVAWDGRDEAGDIVPNGVYLVVIKAQAGAQKVVKYTKAAVLRR